MKGLLPETMLKDNLLRLKVPDPDEEQDELWAASSELVEIGK